MGLGSRVLDVRVQGLGLGFSANCAQINCLTTNCAQITQTTNCAQIPQIQHKLCSNYSICEQINSLTTNCAQITQTPNNAQIVWKLLKLYAN